MDQWNRNMEKMRALNQKAYEWLERMAPNTWVRAFFSTYNKCDVLLNNSCEVFNNYILDAREMPILSMLEHIKGQLMSRYYNKEKEVGEVCFLLCTKRRWADLLRIEGKNQWN